VIISSFITIMFIMNIQNVTKGVIRSRKSKDRENNGQKKKKTKGQVLTPTVSPKVVSVYWYH